MARPRVVVVGGGFGGLTATRALAHAPVDLLLVDRHNHHVFQPLLYQVATAALSPGDIASPIRWILRRQRNVRVWLAQATRIDPKAGTVHLADGPEPTVPFDYLILSAGVSHTYFGHDEWRAAAPGLKSLDDALRIRSRVLTAFEEAERETDPAAQRRLLTFVIVGGGPTGVELAGALAEISRHALTHDFRAIDPKTARIILIEGGPGVLASYPAPLSAFARRALERLGVHVWTKSHVTGVEPGKVRVADETIAAGTILWAAGVAGSPLGQSLGTAVDKVGRVVVADDLSVPGYPNIFVIGDLAAFPTPDGHGLPGVAQVAMQQGRAAARNVRRTIAGQPRERFVYHNLGDMATIGRNSAIADLGWVRLKGYVAWLVWLFVHIANLIGFRNRLTVMTQWAVSYLTYQRSVRLITRDDPPAERT
jgi:NADH dehydrogenase